MKLNHLNLAVTDVLEAKKFLEKYFGLQNQGGGKNLSFLSDDNGLLLSLMKADQATRLSYPANFHIGFIQESEEQVNQINQRLKDDGYDVPPPQRFHAWTFYFQAPGGFTIEVLA